MLFDGRLPSSGSLVERGTCRHPVQCHDGPTGWVVRCRVSDRSCRCARQVTTNAFVIGNDQSPRADGLRRPPFGGRVKRRRPVRCRAGRSRRIEASACTRGIAPSSGRRRAPEGSADRSRPRLDGGWVRSRGAPGKAREAELAELSQEHLDDLRVVFELKLP
jgi:hypothetical protein